MPRLTAAAALVAAVAAATWVAIAPAHSGLPLLLAAVGLLVAGAAWLETGPADSKEIVLVATLAAVVIATFMPFVVRSSRTEAGSVSSRTPRRTWVC